MTVNCCKMISSPSFSLLDERTSGLDSSKALQVIKMLCHLTALGETVVVVIHQPNQHVFSLFDYLLLLSDGRLIYYGEDKKVRDFVGNLGYKTPKEVGMAEHILDCIILDMDKLGDSLQELIDQLNNLADHAMKAKVDLNAKNHFIEVAHKLIECRPKTSLLSCFNYF